MKKKRDDGIPVRGTCVKKWFLVMKLICVFTLFLLFKVSANGLAQKKINLDLERVSMLEIIQELRQQTGYKFFFNHNELKKVKDVSVKFVDEELERVLDVVLGNVNLAYRIEQGVIIIVPGKVKDGEKEVRIVGSVTDEKKHPLPGVTVIVKGLTLGTTTGVNGRFSLTLPRMENVSLLFSFIGMETQEVKYTGQDTIRVVMKESAEQLDEVIVRTGYQNIDKRKLTSAVQTIKMDDIKVAGVNTIDQMLEGRIPGMIFMQNSGQVGAAPRLRIRGTSTVLGNREPLWVLDGVVLTDPVNVDPAQINDLDFVNLLGNAISGLNPNDIEQIDVLKDASATALYGAKAGNGVIVITTKKGKIGPPSVTYSVTGTYTRRPRYSDRAIYLMNSKERVDVSREMVERKIYYDNFSAWTGYEAAIQDYFSGAISYEEYNKTVGYYETLNTDWFDLICRDVFSHNHTLSLSGGASNMRYYASIGMNDENGTIKGENNKRYSTSLNLTANYEKFSVQFQIQGNVSSRNYNPSELGLLNYAYNTSRAVPAFYSDGSRYFYQRFNNYQLFDFNVLNEMENSSDKTTGSAINTKAHVLYNVLDGLRLEGTLSYATSNMNQEVYFTENTYYVYQLRGDQTERNDLCPIGGEFRESNVRNVNWMARLQANYTKTLGKEGKHYLNGSAGIEVSSQKYSGFSITRRGFNLERGKTFSPIPANYTQYHANFMQSAAALGVLSDNLTNTMAWYAMAGYGYDDRYLFNIHVRTESSNLFGMRANDRVMPIWALSGRWNIKKDILESVAWIDDIALRGSFGYQGNMLSNQTPNMIIQKGGYNNKYEEYISTVASFPNPDLKWEKTASTNITLDFSVLNNKINGSVSWYYKKTKDAFMSKMVSEINGVTSYVINNGTLENKGVELAFNFIPINRANVSGGKRGFVWRIDPQLGQVLNKLINKAVNNRNNVMRDEITYDDMLTGNVELAGTPLNTFYSYKFKGLSPEDGSPIFYDTEAELANEYHEKYSVMEKEDVFLTVMEKSGRREPYIQGGISNYFGYRNFGLSFNLTYSLGNKVRLLKLCSSYGVTTPYPQDNLRKEFVNRWRKPGDEEYTNIPGLKTGAANASPWWSETRAATYRFAGSIYDMYDNSNIRVVKGDYLRLSSLSLRYNLEDRFCKKIGLKSAYINLTGTNLFTLAHNKLKGQDPAQSGSTPNVNLSIRPSFSCNISVTF